MTKKNQMLNLRLWIGLILSTFFLLVALFGPLIAPYHPDDAEEIKIIETDQGKKMISPPLPPSSEHLFGTDRWGFDLLTLLLYGAKYTIFTALGVALARIVIGGAIGLYSGMASEQSRFQLKMGPLGSIPTFVIVYFLLVAINTNSPFSPLTLILIQGAVMTVLGLPAVISVVSEKTRNLKQQLYVTASQSMGASHSQVARRHIFPLLKENLLILFINEIIAVLNLLGQLGIFQLFLGGTLFKVDIAGEDYLSVTHEWAGLIGQSRGYIMVHQWIVVFPILAFVLAIFSFYMLARGLEQKYQAQYHRPPHI